MSSAGIYRKWSISGEKVEFKENDQQLSGELWINEEGKGVRCGLCGFVIQ